MKKIKMAYNAYSREAVLDDGSGQEDSWLETRKGKELEDWCAAWLQYLVDSYNDDVEIEFSGIERDSETLEDCVVNFNKEAKDFRIKLIKKEIGGSETIETGGARLEKLKALYKELRSADCPFKSLREDKDIEISFNKALDHDFEIAVVATMSSGKSTLINAMLGTELLPARNEATTATLSHIHDEDEADHFRCEYVDKDGIQKECNPVTLEDMNRLNTNCVPDIHIFGDIVGISSQRLKLVLTDTPGPNNSSDPEHKNHTFKVIKDSKYKPIVLYVLNGTQLETNDDNALLSEIADAMKKGGRQASDRFIFVMNKADEFDVEKGESVERMLAKTRAYLTRHDITNPKIFPCSAYYAKLIRQYLKGDGEFTKKEKAALMGNVALFIEEEDMHFSSMAPLSQAVRKKIDRQLEEAKADENEYRMALVHTGVPAVEGAISEYLEKYALPMKITEALNSFKQIVDDLKCEADEKNKLTANEDKKKELEAALEKIQTLLKDGEKGKAFKKEIDRLSADKEIQRAYESLSGSKFINFISEQKNKYARKGISVRKAQMFTEELKEKLSEFTSRFAIDIQNLIDEHIGKEAQKYVDEYNSYVESLLGGAFGHEVKAASVLGSLAHISLSYDAVEDYTYEKEVKVGSHMETETKTETAYKKEERTKKVKKDGWFDGAKRFFGGLIGTDWGYEYKSYTVDVPYEREYEVQYEVDDYETREYVDYSNFFQNEFVPMFDNFAIEARNYTFNTAKEEISKLKTSFKASFDELDAKIQEKLKEESENLQSQEKFEAMIKENEKNLSWIVNFKKNLNEALG